MIIMASTIIQAINECRYITEKEIIRDTMKAAAYKFKVVQVYPFDVINNKYNTETILTTNDYIQAVNTCKENNNTFVIRNDNEIPYKNIETLCFSSFDKTYDKY